MNNSFENKTVLVTGSTSGIGKATALRFAELGANVVVTGRREAEGSATAKQIESKGARAFYVAGDVSNESDVVNICSRVKKTFGHLDFVFANAGVWGNPQPIAEENEANINQIIDINIKGVLYTLKHTIPMLAANGGGSIVTNASVLGIRPMPGTMVYNASKFAVVGITKTAALECAELKIRVNCVAPGPIETDMLTSALGNGASELAKQLPLKRLGEVNDIANTVLWLCSPEAGFITGQIIPVDGGMSAR